MTEAKPKPTVWKISRETMRFTTRHCGFGTVTDRFLGTGGGPESSTGDRMDSPGA